jgi:hypothetical protein
VELLQISFQAGIADLEELQKIRVIKKSSCKDIFALAVRSQNCYLRSNLLSLLGSFLLLCCFVHVEQSSRDAFTGARAANVPPAVPVRILGNNGTGGTKFSSHNPIRILPSFSFCLRSVKMGTHSSMRQKHSKTTKKWSRRVFPAGIGMLHLLHERGQILRTNS